MWTNLKAIPQRSPRVSSRVAKDLGVHPVDRNSLKSVSSLFQLCLKNILLINYLQLIKHTKKLNLVQILTDAFVLCRLLNRIDIESHQDGRNSSSCNQYFPKIIKKNI